LNVTFSSGTSALFALAATSFASFALGCGGAPDRIGSMSVAVNRWDSAGVFGAGGSTAPIDVARTARDGQRYRITLLPTDRVRCSDALAHGP
jgi:hypothetical protein